MANIVVTRVTRDGVELGAQTTSTGAAVTVPDNDGNVLVEVENPTAGELDVVFAATAEVAGHPLSDLTVSVPAGDTLWVGPFPPVVFNTDEQAVSVVAESGLKLRGARI